MDRGLLDQDLTQLNKANAECNRIMVKWWTEAGVNRAITFFNNRHLDMKNSVRGNIYSRAAERVVIQFEPDQFLAQCQGSKGSNFHLNSYNCKVK